MKKYYLIFISAFYIFLLTEFNSVCAQNIETDTTRLEWFGDAKLGIFIHWGIYSVKWH